METHSYARIDQVPVRVALRSVNAPAGSALGRRIAASRRVPQLRYRTLDDLGQRPTPADAPERDARADAPHEPAGETP